MESFGGESSWDGLSLSSLTATGQTNLTPTSLFSDLISLNSSHTAGSFFGLFPENATATPPQPQLRDQVLARAEIAVLGLVLALTSLGNGFVLWVLLRRRKYNAPMHLFMVNLCVADLVVALFQVLPQLVWDITERFQGPDVLCRSVKYLQIVGMFASSYMIVAMTVDRHYAICCPLQAYRGGAVSRWNTPIMVAWALALILSIPQVFIFSRSEVAPGEFECWGHFAEVWGLKAYVTWMTVAVFVLPALIITVCQIRIFREIHNNIYLKSERVVTAELKKNEVFFRFHSIKKEDERFRERGRRSSGGGGGGGGGGGTRDARRASVLKGVNNNPSGSHNNTHNSQVHAGERYDYASPVTQYSSCHGECTQQGPLSAAESRANAPTTAAATVTTPCCDCHHGPATGGCYCQESSYASSYELDPPGGCHRGGSSPRTSMDYVSSSPLSPGGPPPSITKAMSKTVRMTLVIVLVYTVCWSPFFIVQLWAAWDPNPPDQGVAFTILMLLASLNSCTNPWIYTAFSSSVSRELQGLLRCRPRPGRRGSMHDDSTTTHTSTTKDTLY